MTNVSIFHNVSRDASFGLNSVFRTGDVAPEGVRSIPLSDGKFGWKEEGTGDERHELVWVFQYEVKGGNDDLILADAWEMFNIGEGPTATAYRARKLRSLSKGDVVAIDGRFYSCESVGWKERTVRELRTLTAAQAEPVIRSRFQFGPREELSITVPLAD